MCGMAGVIGPGADRAEVDAMVARLHHRGPDGARVDVAPGAVLGHTWLRIVGRPLTPDGAPPPQPLTDGRFWLVFNGELVDQNDDATWLFDQLRARGEAVLPELQGMFALTFWDSGTGTGFLARDAAGIKPLVWAERGGDVLFASETPALRAVLAAAVDEAAFARWMTLPAFSGDDPPFVGLHALPAGHLLRLGGTPRVERWFEADTTPVVDVDAFLDELRATLTSVVRQTATWHLPTGLLLSGGLDSSLIAAIGRPQRAWHVRFDEAPPQGAISFDDDGPWAERVAATTQIPLTAVHVPRASLPDRIAAVARHDAHLPAWEQQLTQDALFAAVDTRVVLVGDCADETWAGYHFLLRPEVRSPAGVMAFFHAEERAAYLRQRLAKDAVQTTLTSLDPDPHERIRQRWLSRLMHNGDLHSMRHGVEARPPFGDVRLLRLAARCPEALATRRGWEKWPLRAVAPLEPAVAFRRKSALPKDQGSGEVLRDAVRAALDAGGAMVDWLDADRLAARVADPGPLAEHERAVFFAALAVNAWAPVHAR